jgi:hypothetical protein
MTETIMVTWHKHMQVRYCFVYLIAKNTTVKMEFVLQI